MESILVSGFSMGLIFQTENNDKLTDQLKLILGKEKKT